MHAITYIDLIGYANAALGVAMLCMRTMIPLRITGITHNIVSIMFGWFAGVYPMLIQHAILLPMNSFRLYEMKKLVREVKDASAGDLSMDWIRPFAQRMTIGAGKTLFRKGDPADRLYYIVSGRLRVNELGIELGEGQVLGELGFISPSGERTQSVECLADAVLLETSYDRLEQMYFQNPKFGFYFLRLTSARLFNNIDRLEQAMRDKTAEIADLRRKLSLLEQPSPRRL